MLVRRGFEAEGITVCRARSHFPGRDFRVEAQKWCRCGRERMASTGWVCLVVRATGLDSLRDADTIMERVAGLRKRLPAVSQESGRGVFCF